MPESDLHFITFFNHWCDTNQVKEYYLIDKNGSLLLINNKGEHYYFIIHSDRTLDTLVELYDDAKEVSQLIEMVKQRSKIFFFGAGNDAWDFKNEEWEDYFHSPQLLQGREQYYWAVTARPLSAVKAC